MTVFDLHMQNSFLIKKAGTNDIPGSGVSNVSFKISDVVLSESEFYSGCCNIFCDRVGMFAWKTLPRNCRLKCCHFTKHLKNELPVIENACLDRFEQSLFRQLQKWGWIFNQGDVWIRQRQKQVSRCSDLVDLFHGQIECRFDLLFQLSLLGEPVEPVQSGIVVPGMNAPVSHAARVTRLSTGRQNLSLSADARR